MHASYRCYAGFGPSSACTGIPSTRQRGEIGVASQVLRLRVRSQLSQSRSISLLLAKSSRVYLSLQSLVIEDWIISPQYSTFVDPLLLPERDGRTCLARPNFQARTRIGRKTFFLCSADHEQDWQPYPVDPYQVLCYDMLYVMCCCLIFIVLVANPKILLYTVANPARDLLNREKRTKESLAAHPPRCSFGGNRK